MWAKLDDKTFTDTLAEVGKDAKLLYLAGLCACASKLTDGYISPAAVRMSLAAVDAPAATCEELVAAGLWEARPDGAYHCPRYLEDNPSAAKVAREREQGAKRQADFRQRQRLEAAAQQAQRAADENARRNAVTHGVTGSVTGGSRNDVTDGVSDAAPVPVPDPVSVPVQRGEPSDRGRARDSSRAGGGGGAPARVIPLREGQAPDAQWYRMTYRWFVASYPKGVPAGVQDEWRELCPDQTTFDRIKVGLEAWKLCRQWADDKSKDFVTKPITWLRERYYDYPPLPWRPDIPDHPETDLVGVEKRDYPQPPEERERPGLAAETQRRLASLLTPLDGGAAYGPPRPAPGVLEARYAAGKGE